MIIKWRKSTKTHQNNAEQPNREQPQPITKVQEPQEYDYEGNGVYRTPKEEKTHGQWINEQHKWKEQRMKKDRMKY